MQTRIKILKLLSKKLQQKYNRKWIKVNFALRKIL